MIIGVCGNIGAGKDTLAQRLIDTHGFIRVNFADALKHEVLSRFPRTVRAILALHKPESVDDAIARDTFSRIAVHQTKPLGIRELLQEFGTEVRRADDPDYWVRQWLRRVGVIKGHIVTTDVRFPNEFKTIRSFEPAATVWRIERPGCIPPLGAHPSETAWRSMPVDHTFHNDGTVASLWNQVDAQLAAQGWT